MKRITADNYFSIIPEWVLYSDITATAVRLYATLQRYADKDTGECHPSRATLATKCNCTVKSIDRALTELIAIGAVNKRQRVSANGDLTSNHYQVITVPQVASEMSLPRDKNDTRGRDKNDTETIVSVKQSQEPTAAQSIAEQWWIAYKERTGGKTPTGKGAWHSLLAIINGALKSGWTEQQVTTALMQLNVPSATMLDVQLNKLIVEQQSTRHVVRVLPDLIGDVDCVVCDGAGFIVDFDTDEQQHKSRWCECRTEKQKPHH